MTTTTANPSRRGLLAGLGAVAALAGGTAANVVAIAATRPAAVPSALASLPAAVSEDPVFAAIEAHKAAKAALDSAMDAFNALDHKMIEARRKGRRAPNGWRAARERWNEACRAETGALTALALTIATTPDGAAAQVDYWAKSIGAATETSEEWDDCTVRDAMRLMTSLVFTIRGLSGGAS